MKKRLDLFGEKNQDKKREVVIQFITFYFATRCTGQQNIITGENLKSLSGRFFVFTTFGDSFFLFLFFQDNKARLQQAPERCGDLRVSALVSRSSGPGLSHGQAVTLYVLCSEARHFTLTVPFFIQVCKWVPANLMLMDQHPIEGGVEILLVASCCRNRDTLRPGWPLGSYADFTFNRKLQSCLSQKRYLPAGTLSTNAAMKVFEFFLITK